MDAQDLAIVAHLLREPLAPWSAIGRERDLSPTAVAKRVERLEADGVLAGFVALPSADVFGRVPRLHYIEDPGDASDGALVERLVRAEPVVWVSGKADGAVSFVTYDAPAANVRGPALSDVLATRVVETAESGSFRSEPPGAVDLSPVAWRVLRAMLEAPRAGPSELAQATGLTRKAVRTHRDELMTHGHVRVLPIVLPPSEPGELICHLSLGLAHQAALASVLNALDDVQLIARTAQPPGLYLLARTGSLPELEEMGRRLATLDGVEAVEVDVPRDFAVARDRLVAWTDEALARWEAVGPERSAASEP